MGAMSTSAPTLIDAVLISIVDSHNLHHLLQGVAACVLPLVENEIGSPKAAATVAGPEQTAHNDFVLLPQTTCLQTPPLLGKTSFVHSKAVAQVEMCQRAASTLG